MAIKRELAQADPMRAYGVTHREYDGALTDAITLYGTYGALVGGAFVPDSKLVGWNRSVAGSELIEMLLWAGVSQDTINAALASGDLGDLVVANLTHIGPFLDHDNRWAARPLVVNLP